MTDVQAAQVKTYGTREEVFNGTARKTKGNLVKDDIIFDNNRYKSKKAVEKGKQLMQKLRTSMTAKTEEAGGAVEVKSMEPVKTVKSKKIKSEQ